MHTHTFYTVRQLADLANCRKTVIQKRLERGQLASFRQGRYGKDRGGRHVILATDAARFLAEYKPRTLKTAGTSLVQS
jgi:hypothetical protein